MTTANEQTSSKKSALLKRYQPGSLHYAFMKFSNRHPDSTSATGMDRRPGSHIPQRPVIRQTSTIAVAFAIAIAVILVVSIMIGLCSSHFPY